MQNLQTINLDILNNKVFDYIYTKQYDEGRQVRFYITENGTPLTLDDYTIIFSLKKPDGTVIIEDDQGEHVEVESTYVTLTLSGEMTVLAGKIPYQLTTSKDGVIISTITGYIVCDKAVVQDDDVRSTDGGNLGDLIEELSQIYQNNVFDTRTATLLANAWEENQQTVQVPGIVSQEMQQLITIIPANDNIEEYAEKGVYCSGQSTGALTFKCASVPEHDLNVYIVAQGINSPLGNIGVMWSATEPSPFDQQENDIWIQDYE